jgi:hypothetical protein
MASTAGSTLGRRLGVLIAGLVVVTSLTVASAGAAAAPPPRGSPAGGTGPGAPLALGPWGATIPSWGRGATR